jgi:DNA-binding GntR family transcriptional regulator
MPTGFLPVDRQHSIRPQVYAALREAIVRLQFKPGDLLSEKDIATQLGASRTPVREALIQLAQEGLVEIFPQIGTRVSRLKIAEIMEALFIREALECAAARSAATRMTPADLEKLRATVEAHRRAQETDDLDAVAALDEEFHHLIVERSGFPTVWRLIRSARAHLMRLRNLTVPQLGTAARTVRFHSEIVDGLASRDPAAAERYMRAHQASNVAYTQDLLRTIPEYFEGNIEEYLEFPPPWSVDTSPPLPSGTPSKRTTPSKSRSARGRTS